MRTWQDGHGWLCCFGRGPVTTGCLVAEPIEKVPLEVNEELLRSDTTRVGRLSGRGESPAKMSSAERRAPRRPATAAALVGSALLLTGCAPVALAVVLAGSGGRSSGGPPPATSVPPSPPPPVALLLEIVSGSGQSALAGTPLPSPLVVRVRDSTGAGVGNIPVSFEASSGTPLSSTATTNAQGLALTDFVVALGSATIVASAPGLQSVMFLANGTASPSPPAPGPNLLSLSFSRGTSVEASTGSVLSFSVTVSHSLTSRPATLRLLHVPPECVVAPSVSQATPFTRAVTWRPTAAFCGQQRLIFEATDGSSTIREVVSVSITGGWRGAVHAGVQVGDVTGDGRLDLVASARPADVAALDCGAVYVWAGDSTFPGTPTATLRVPTASANDRLGDASGQGIQLMDVTGDGVLDLVVGARLADAGGADRGAIYVWKGGSSLHGTLDPTATLRVSSASDSDKLGEAAGQGVLLGDVTGDGVADIVAAARFADVGGTDRGAVYVWPGGSALSGTLDPDATLLAPDASNGDQLGFCTGQGVLLADVTGDLVLDIVAAAQMANRGATADTGALYVWEGGSTLTGAPAPLATLRVSTSASGDQLGKAGGRGVLIGDVSGDGIVDVIAGAHQADDGGTLRGAIYVWHGGAALSGSSDPTATLRVSTAANGNNLGFCAEGDGVQLADVSGDGVLDVVAGSVQGDGAVYTWTGGAGLTGTLDPTATLQVAGSDGTLRLGTASGQGVVVGDVTGDGVPDILAATVAYPTVAQQRGAVFVWSGGASLSGPVAPLATLRVSTAANGDQLGNASGQGLQLGDVSGDGVLDVVVGARFADMGGEQRGAIYVWHGGPTILGTLDPSATLSVSTASDTDRLGDIELPGQGVLLADVSGDGVPDVIAHAALARSTGDEYGAVYMWRGGAGLTGAVDPSATLHVPGVVADDQIGNAAGQGVLIGDVSGDGALDVVAGAKLADVGGSDRGAAYMWRGGASLSGSVAPHASLSVSTAADGDQLGEASGQGILLADVTGDGALDLAVGARLATSARGRGFVWPGGTGLSGDPAPVDLGVIGATVGDRLTD